MIKTILIDDEPLARQMVKEYLRDFPEFEVVAECGDGFEGVKAIAQHGPEVVFLDIQMPKINGFEMLELIDNPPAVIFTTAFDEYALKAFELKAVDYLLKPFSKDRFQQAIRTWLSRRNTPGTSADTTPSIAPPEERQRLVVKKGTNIVILPIKSVFYLEAFDDYVKIHTADGFYLKKKTMSHYERLLDPEFIRIHRSFIINLQELTRIEPMEKDTFVALLKNGTRLPLSESGYARLRKVLGM